MADVREASVEAEADDRAEVIGARLHRAGIPALDLYAMIGLEQDADDAEIARRIARAKRLLAEGRASDRAQRQIPLIERVLGNPRVRRVYDQERSLMAAARANQREGRQNAPAPSPPAPATATPSAGTVARESAQRAVLRGDLAMAVELAEEAMDLDPSAASAVSLSGVTRRSGDLEAAERAARAAIEMAPAAPEAHLALARVLADRGDRQEALGIVERVIADHPRAAGAEALARRLR